MALLLGCLPRSSAVAVGLCAAYALVSMALALLNKALLSSYGFRAYFLLLASQMGFSYFFCVVSRDVLGNPFGVPRFSAKSLRAGTPMGCLYVGNVVVGMVGLKLVNVPLFFALRRLTPATIIALDYALSRKTVDGGVQLAVAVSVLGTLVAAWDTLSSDGLGYAITLANNAVTAGLMISQARFSGLQAAIQQQEAEAAEAAAAVAKPAAPDADGGGAAGSQSSARAPALALSAQPPQPPSLAGAPPPAPPAKVSAFGVLYYNAIVATPLALALSAATGEISYVATFPHLAERRFQAGFAVSSCLGLLLTYTSVLCTTYTGPLAASMAGCVRGTPRQWGAS